MESPLTQIEFYFPENKIVASKEKLAGLIFQAMKKAGSTEYAGHPDEESLHRGISQCIGNGDFQSYRPISLSEQKRIQETIESMVLKCNEKLTVPTKNFIFVFPYLPTEDDSVFKGIMAVARYSCVFHIFLSPDLWTPEALADTVAHELNHTIFYYHHFSDFGKYTLLDELVIEGLAENFREQVVSKIPAAWAVALTKEKAFELLKSMKEEMLYSKDSGVIKSFLFGNKKYERWTGYSVGYWMVKEFIDKNPNLSWEEIMKFSSEEILRVVEK